MTTVGKTARARKGTAFAEAKRIVLGSRSSQLSDDDAARIEGLRRRGVEIELERVDAINAVTLEQLFHRCAARGAIKGVVHAAMVIDDRLIDGMDRDAIDAVLQPKVTGALNLERLAAGLNLDYLLFYSSATTLFGNPGQYNYVAANGFLEGLARRLHARGIPAVAVAWGGIADAGYLARNIATDANLKKRFSGAKGA